MLQEDNSNNSTVSVNVKKEEKEKDVAPPGYQYLRLSLLAASLFFCFLVYGILQERIMTIPFGEKEERFGNSAFLVLSNRIVAVLVALFLMWRASESVRPVVPLQHYLYISLSNTFSSLCQYEALKFVSFPTQTLGKCGKIIPVMIIGTFVSGKKYGWLDYLYAFLISVGCGIFYASGSVSAPHKKHGVTSQGGVHDEWYGLFLIFLYLFIDGFTSVFQERLFKKANMSTNNQMLYVNMWSAVISTFVLIWENQLVECVTFSIQHPDFFLFSNLLSVSASLGQISILYTIKEFGALIFSIIMTTRQLVNILLSCVLFLHHLSVGQWIGTVIVFVVLYLEAKKPKRGHSTPPPPSTLSAPGPKESV